MNNFKFFQEKKESLTLLNNNPNRLMVNQHILYDECEYLFQFNNDEPISLGRTYNNGDLTLILRPHEGANIVFHDHNGNSFKLFANPIV